MRYNKFGVMGMNIDEVVGDNIRKYRQMRGLTQKDLGDRIGVKHNTISQYEKGRNAPEQNMIFAIANALNVSVGDLFPQTTKTPDESYIKLLAMSDGLSDRDKDYLKELIEKAHSLDEQAREDFFKNIRFAVEYFDRNL